MINNIKNLKYVFYLSYVIFLFICEVSYSSEIKAGGFIFDQTRTRLGREFYDLFVMQWDPPEGMISSNVAISEFTDPRFGSQVVVYVEDAPVYSTILKPRYEELELAVNEAVNAILQYFLMLLEQNRALQEELKFFY